MSGEAKGWIDIITCRKDFFELGSFASSSKLVAISQVLPVAIPADKAACLARHDANLSLLFVDRTELKVGTNLIFVPSGYEVEDDPYQIDNFFLTSYTRLLEHSMCKA
jgi:hypothetical protein